MNEAAIYTMRENEQFIHQRHLSMAIDKVMMGERSDRESNLEEKKRVAIHELGHAIMAELVRPGSVKQVALSPRGKALGMFAIIRSRNSICTQNLPGRADYDRSWRRGRRRDLLRGRSTGSSNDFEQSLNIVETMMKSGLTSLGIVNMNMVTTEELMKENNVILKS